MNATCPFLYYSKFLRVNEDDIDDSDSNPRMELLQEGFLASAACFLVCVTASHQESDVPKSLPPFAKLLWAGDVDRLVQRYMPRQRVLIEWDRGGLLAEHSEWPMSHGFSPMWTPRRAHVCQ